MALSPDDIERRIFAVTDSGYDTDEVRKFLFEVAAAVRFARHSTEPPLSLHGPPPADATRWPARPPKPSVHETVEALRTQAEVAAAEILEDARHDATEIRREAQEDAEFERDRAKRLLNTAKTQATDIVADAEAQAQAIMTAASAGAREQVRDTVERARRHAEDVLRIERDALAHLQSAQADGGRAIESISRSDDRPVVDLTRPVTTLRFGIPSDLSDEAMPTVGSHDENLTDHNLPGETFAADALGRDPVLKLVRKAVERAVSAAATDDTATADEAVDTPGASGASGASEIEAPAHSTRS